MVTGVQSPRDQGFFTGPERLEPFAAVGGLIRKGLPAELSVSDVDRVHAALRARDGERARAYLSIIDRGGEFMVVGYSEFALNFAAVLARRPGADRERVATRAFALWETGIAGDGEVAQAITALRAIELLQPDRISESSVDMFRRERAEGCAGIADRLLEPSRARRARLSGLLEGAAFCAAMDEFDAYYGELRIGHDVLCELCAAYGSALADQHGQATAEAVTAEAFTTCSFYEGLWTALGAMTPEEVAAFLADHLRAHYSGAGRAGSVGVIETPDRYRLVFDPCGSGGAIRRRAARGLSGAAVRMPGPSPRTWHRTGEVPAYCTHCANNELDSIRRFGYPLFVTEFDPDPEQPCGWTVFKNRRDIPATYFARLGVARDGIGLADRT